MSSEETITISVKEYKSLKDDSYMLTCLESAGVDNWNGYDYAIDEYNQRDSEENIYE